MKVKLLSITVIIIMFLSACQPLGILSGGGKSKQYAYIFEANSNPINVDIQLDDGLVAEAVIPVKGGSLSVTGKDGTTYTLTIPDDALLVETKVSMTPISNLSGMPFGSGDPLAVQLNPEGLTFNNYVTLTITPAQEITIDQQLMFEYLGNGEDVILAPPVVDSSEIKIQLLHFSGYGVTKGYLADIEPVRQRIGGTAERRLQNLAAERLGRERQSQLLGSDDEVGNIEDFADLFDQYQKEVVDMRIAAALESCAAGQLALQTLLGFERQKQLLGFGSLDMASVVELANKIGIVCIKEEYEMCKTDHVIHRMIPIWLGMRRQSELLGAGQDSEAIALALELSIKCLTFDLVFTSEGSFDAGSADGYDSAVTSTIKLKFVPEELTIKGQAQLINTAFEFRASDCSTESTRGGGEISVYSMPYVVQEDIPPGEVGKVIDFNLVYFPGNTSEVFAVQCEDQPKYTAPPSPMWTGIYLVTHQMELDQAKGGFFYDDWEIFGNEYFAKKEWITTYESEGLLETGTFKLYHRPQ